MKLDFIFILIFVTYSGQTYGQYVTLIGSPYIQNEPNHKLILLSHKLDSNSSVTFSLGGNDEIKTLQKSLFSVVELKYPEDKSKNNEINIATNVKNKCTLQTIKLIDTAKSPVIFIQFDKPIYKTGDDFKFRIIVLNQNLVPSTDNIKVDVSVFDSRNYIIQKFNHINKIRSEYGVYEGVVRIADAPNLGKWKIQVTAANRNLMKTFDVQKPSEENVEVFLEMSPLVAFIDKRVYVTILVKDNTDKFFTGTASVSVSARFKGSERIEVDKLVKKEEINGNRKGTVVDFADDLGIRYPTADMILRFNVEVTDKASNRVGRVWREIEMKHKGKNTIQVIRKEYFKPGFNRFPTKVRVKVLDGRPDNSFNQLSITNEYYGKSKTTGKPIKSQKTFKVNLKNGEALNILQTKAEIDKIIVRLEFAGTELTETILPHPTFKANEYLQVNMVNKSTNVNDKILFSAQTTGEMETLHVVVFGISGIIHVEEFPDAEGKDVYDFTLKLTENMKPEAKMFVFYVHEKTGVLIYDELSISLGFSIDNSLEISAEKSSNPRRKTNVKFKTEQGSKVFISATDQNPAPINRDNEISRGEIYNELVYYLNLKFKNSSIYHFEKMNSFVLHTLKSGAPCESGTSNTLTQESNVNDAVIDTNPVKYFPDLWIDKDYDARSNQIQTVDLTVPDSLVSWRFFGISVHPQKGFTVAKVQPRITIKNDISIQLKTPPTAYEDEVLWIDFGVFNSLNDNLDSEVHVSIENGFFVDKIDRQEFNILCLDFKQTQPKDKSFKLNIPSEKSSKTTTFLIQADGKGDLSITIVAVAGNYNDEVTKVIKIEKKMEKTLISSNLLELNGRKKLENIVGRDDDVVVAIYGNLLGPALDGLEHLFSTQMKTDEAKILKFTAATVSLKFLKMINEPSKKQSQKLEKLMSDLIVGYQEALSILDKISQPNDSCNSAWLAALTVQVLIDAQHFIEVDQNVIKKALTFIDSQRYDDGAFIYDDICDYRREMSTDDRELVSTVEILMAFLKDLKIRQEFKTEVENSVKYLKSQTMQEYLESAKDYPKVLVAYALALNDDKDGAKELLNRMDNKFLRTSRPQFYSQFHEIASYKILTKIILNFDPQDEVKWLLERRSADGGFYSPYNTVLALKALYEYSKYKNLQSVDLKISSNQIGRSITNPVDSQVIELKKSQMLHVEGEGVGYVHIYKEFVQEPKNTSEYFLLNAFRTDERNDHMKLDVTLSLNGTSAVNNLLVLEVELPQGFKFVNHNLKENLLSLDVRNDRNLLVFYMKKLEQEQTITITASKIFEFSNHKSSMIKVYDYYRTNIMDSIYYVHDRREENCERIRVEHEIKKAENAQAVTNKANQITEEATNSAERANSAINEADKKYKNADQNIQTAENKINSANSVVESANHIVSEALRIAEDAAKIEEVRISSRYPPEQEVNENEEYPECYVDQVRRTRRTEEQETSEAIRKQEVADDKDKKLEIAECVASKAKINAENAKNDTSRKQQEADNARLKAAEALEEVNNAKGQAESLRNEVTIKQREVNEELQKVKTGRNKANNAKAVIESAQGENAEVNQAVMTSKNNVQNAFTVTKNALTLAQNSYKAIEAQDSVTSASELASQTKLNAEVARRNANNAESRSSSALTGITQAETEVTHIREKVEQILHQTKEIKSRTEESKSKSKEADTTYRAAIKLTEDLQKQADEADHKYQIANKKEATKSEAEEQAKREAREARASADEAREVEVQIAVDFASSAERYAAEAEKLAKEITIIKQNIEQKKQVAINDRTEAAKILLDLKISNQATVSSEENHKMNQIEQKAKTAEESNKNAQEESQKARQAASEAQNAANNAKSTTDAIKTVENSRKASKEAENAKSAKEKTSAQKSIAEEAKNDCEEAKIIAVETKKCADAANNMNLLMKELNEEKSLIIEASKSAREAINEAKLFLTEVKKIDSSQEINTAINELNAIDRSINTTINKANLAQKNVNSARIRGFNAFESAIKATDYNAATRESRNCELAKQAVHSERNKISAEKQNAENNKKSAFNIQHVAEVTRNEAEQTKIAEEIQKATQSEEQARIYSQDATQEATRVKDTQTDIQEVISNLENAMRLTDEATELFGESRMESANLIKTDELGVTKIASKAAEDAQQVVRDARKLAEDMKFVKKVDEAIQKANEAKQNEENAKKAHEFAVDARKTANEAKKAVDAAKEAYEKSLKVEEMFETILSTKRAIENAINEAQTAMNEAIEYGATQNEVNKALITEQGRTTFETIKLRTEKWFSEANNTKISSSKAVKEAYEAAKVAIKAEDFETASEEVKNSIAAKEIVQNAQNSTVKPSKAFEYFSKIAETIKTKAIDIKVEAEKKKKLDVETKATRLAINANLEATETEKISNQIKDAKTVTDMAINAITNAEKATKEAKGLAGLSKSGEESNDLSLIVEKANNATKSAEASVKKSKEAARNAQQAANDAKKAKDLKSTIEYANKVDEEKKSAMYARREAEKAKSEAEDAKRSALERQTKAQNSQRLAVQARISQEKTLAEKSRKNTVQAAQTAETEAKKIDQAKKEYENIENNIIQISNDINVLLDVESAPEVNRKIENAKQTAQKATKEAENAATNAAQQLKLARNSNRHANQQIKWNDKVADAIKIASTMKRAENSATQAMNAVSQFAKKAESAKATADQAMQTALDAKTDAENIRKEKEIEKAKEEKTKLDEKMKQAREEVEKAKHASESAKTSLENAPIEVEEIQNPSEKLKNLQDALKEVIENAQSKVTEAEKAYKNANEIILEMNQTYENIKMEATTVEGATILLETLTKALQTAEDNLNKVKRLSDEASDARENIRSDIDTINNYQDQIKNAIEVYNRQSHSNADSDNFNQDHQIDDVTSQNPNINTGNNIENGREDPLETSTKKANPPLARGQITDQNHKKTLNAENTPTTQRPQINKNNFQQQIPSKSTENTSQQSLVTSTFKVNQESEMMGNIKPLPTRPSNDARLQENNDILDSHGQHSQTRIKNSQQIASDENEATNNDSTNEQPETSPQKFDSSLNDNADN